MAVRAGGFRRTGPALHEPYLRHAGFRWAKVAAGVGVAATLAYMLVDQQPRPNGGTALGYALGTLGAALILWLSALGIRKRVVGHRSYSLKGWTSAHVYLGLILAVVATLHAGFQLGWNVHGLAYVLMLAVIASGVWGVTAYARLPRAMSANRGEMTQPQMLEGLRSLDRQLDEAAQPLDGRHSEMVRASLEDTVVAGGLLSRLSAQHWRCGTARANARIDAELARGAPDPDGHLAMVAALLDRKAAALAQARQHIRLRAWLELWLYVHVPLTFALLAALTAHIVSVFFYW